MASFIARLAVEGGLDVPTDAPDAFSDDSGSVHEGNINALAELGVVQGREGRYFPDESVSRAQMASFVMRDLGLQIVEGVAYFGGALVTLDATDAAEGAVSGKVETNKQLQSLVADGCGLEGQDVEVADDDSFTVQLGEDQAGQCQLVLSATTSSPATSAPAQTVTWEFTVTVT